ncbi:MAG: peptidoglycan DD-metalloendopeptidase family protein [Pseudohongiellaceae bacterium]
MIRNLVILLLPTVLIACKSDPAPVVERGERISRTSPVIVSGNAPDSVLQASNQRPRIIQSSTALPAPSTLDLSESLPGVRTHRVQSGESLHAIAYRYDLDFRQIALANDLRPPYIIYIDQQLRLDVTQSAAPTSTQNNNVASTNAVSSAAANNGDVLRMPIDNNRMPEWQWPHSGRILQGFAAGSSKGLDLAGRDGDPVLAASGGEVVYAGSGIQGSGDLVIIRHTDRYLSAYAHNQLLLVSQSQQVLAGEPIAEVGTNSDGTPMLHFEIRLDGKSVDPLRYLPRR